MSTTLPIESFCKGCQETKPGDQFYVCGKSTAKPYYFRLCRSCASENNRKARSGKTVPADLQKKYAFKYRYGVTAEYVQDLVWAQYGMCAICSTPVTLGSLADDRELHDMDRVTGVVDHDHQTGQVRGVLCHSCNKGLGHFRDNARNVAAALEYLKEWQ